MNILGNDSAVGRGARTLFQAVIAIVVVVWQVPGVPAAIYDTLMQYSFFTIPAIAGVVSFVWNLLRKDVKSV